MIPSIPKEILDNSRRITENEVPEKLIVDSLTHESPRTIYKTCLEKRINRTELVNIKGVYEFSRGSSNLYRKIFVTPRERKRLEMKDGKG